jgi:hypothetical protein
LRNQRQKDLEFIQRTTLQLLRVQRTIERHIEDREDNMKSLKQHICEGLLRGMDDTLADGEVIATELIRAQIDEFMQQNYRAPSYRIIKKPNKDGKYIVNSQGELKLRPFADRLTNDLFVFGKVKIFTVFDNHELRSLEGAPQEVDTIQCIWCYNLESLKGCPKKMGIGLFNDCGIKSLEGLPDRVEGMLDFKNTKIKNLIGAPKYVGGTFDVSECKELESIKGAPEYIGGNFFCEECPNLNSLEGGPKEVGINYWVRANNKLKSFKGVAKTIGGSFIGEMCTGLESLDMHGTTIGKHFNIEICKALKSFDGFPKVGEDIIAHHCTSVTSFKGLPDIVNGELDLSFCPNLNSLEGCPKKVNKYFDLHKGHMWNRADIESVCDCKDIIV